MCNNIVCTLYREIMIFYCTACYYDVEYHTIKHLPVTSAPELLWRWRQCVSWRSLLIALILVTHPWEWSRGCRLRGRWGAENQMTGKKDALSISFFGDKFSFSGLRARHLRAVHWHFKLIFFLVLGSDVQLQPKLLDRLGICRAVFWTTFSHRGMNVIWFVRPLLAFVYGKFGLVPITV